MKSILQNLDSQVNKPQRKTDLADGRLLAHIYTDRIVNLNPKIFQFFCSPITVRKTNLIITVNRKYQAFDGIKSVRFSNSDIHSAYTASRSYWKYTVRSQPIS